MRSVILTVSLVALAYFSPHGVTAQTATPPLRVWVAAGFGSDGNEGGAGSLQLVAQKAPHQFSVRSMFVSPLGADLSDGSAPDVYEISGIYSRVYSWPTVHLAAGAGIGWAHRGTCEGIPPACPARSAQHWQSPLRQASG